MDRTEAGARAVAAVEVLAAAGSADREEEEASVAGGAGGLGGAPPFDPGMERTISLLRTDDPHAHWIVTRADDGRLFRRRRRTSSRFVRTTEKKSIMMSGTV